MKPRIVIALGGNALQADGAITANEQKKVAHDTARRLVELVKVGYDLVITHGNGPQVGNILLGEQSHDASEAPPMPLETAVAMSQGQIGYWLQQAIGDELRSADIDKDVATVVTQVVVDLNDPAFASPSKPIGPFYDQVTAEKLAAERGWTVRADADRGWRRVVASPPPIDIIEKRLISEIANRGAILIAAGGGGIPVKRDGTDLVGVDAVIDKDFTAVQLARLINANIFASLTTVENAVVNFTTINAQPIGQTDVVTMERHIAEGQFAPGSMLPKVQAAIEFAKLRPENISIITTPDKIIDALGGQTGTIIRG